MLHSDRQMDGGPENNASSHSCDQQRGHYSHKDSRSKEKEQWILHEEVVDPAEPRQGRVSVLQVLDPQLPWLIHRGEIPERTTSWRRFNPVDSRQVDFGVNFSTLSVRVCLFQPRTNDI